MENPYSYTTQYDQWAHWEDQQTRDRLEMDATFRQDELIMDAMEYRAKHKRLPDHLRHTPTHLP